MGIFGTLEFFGGLALFLYGMVLLSSSLEKVSGGKLEKTLEKLTNTVLKGVILGTIATVAVQSSSATTVIVVGLVNAKVLKLRNAIGVIMGANIGTTVTAHILSLSDIDSANFFMSLLEPSSLAPMACIIGVGLFLLNAKGKRKDLGVVLLGFGILFTGMLTMSSAVRPLASSDLFLSAFNMFEDVPVLGVLTGTAVTAVLQSSSASVGILQALSTTGVISFAMAFPIIMGQNIGTTITPVLASIGASKNAKRTALIHVLFNITGTVVFLLGFYAIHYFIMPFKFFNDIIDMGTIANFHTVFNVSVTVLFIPFVGLLEKTAKTFIKDKSGTEDTMPDVVVLDTLLYKSPGLAIQHSREAIMQIATLAQQNLVSSTGLLTKYDKEIVEQILEKEEIIDKLQDKTENYLIGLSEKELSDSDSRSLSRLLHISGEFERVADHAVEVLESVQKIKQAKVTFSKKAQDELDIFTSANVEILQLAILAVKDTSSEYANKVMPLEAVIDDMEEQLREKHLDRLRKGKCNVDSAFPFNTILRSLERVGDLCSNIAESVLSYNADKQVDRHEYKTKLSESAEFKVMYLEYKDKYLKAIKKK